jgi:hypothetical protein
VGGYWQAGTLQPLYTQRPLQALRDAVATIKRTVPAHSMIILHDHPWTDLHEPGLGGLAFPNAHNHWKVALDPAVRVGIFGDDWRTVDYLIITPALVKDFTETNNTVALEALRHAHRVAQWASDGEVLELWKVDTGTPTEAAQVDTGTAAEPATPPVSARAGMAPTENAPGPARTPAPAPSPTFRPIFDDFLVDNRQTWPHDPQATAWFADGAYHLFARQPRQFVAIGAPVRALDPPLGGPLRDVKVTARFRKVGGPPGGGYGVIVRDQGPGPRDGINQGGRYYVLEVGDRGELGIWRREGDRWIDLLPWTLSEAVRLGGAANELEVQAIGPQLTLAVNGVPVATVTDSVLAQGAVGVFVGGDLNEVVLERFSVDLSDEEHTAK